MRHSILRFFLIFACVALPLYSHACWDDSYDDYYDYYDYDDDWYDDDWWYDDDIFGDDNTDDEFCFEIDDSDVKNGPSLDNVDVYCDGNDNDWWRTDYGDDDDYGNDDDWFDYDDDSSEDDHYVIRGDNTDDKKTYSLKRTDKLSVKIEDLDKQKGFKQGTTNTCVCAGMEFVAKVFGNNSLSEGDVLLNLFKSEGFGTLNGNFSDVSKLADDLANIANDAGLYGHPDVTSIKGAIDNGELVMTTIPVDTGGNHDVVVVGYNDDGYIVYDTDIKVGDYRIVPEDDINALYKVGIKKK